MRRAATATVATVLLLAAWAAPAASSAVEERDGTLPIAVSMSCAVMAGQVIYMFGGFTQGSLLDTIIEYDLATGVGRVLSDRLPSERKLSSAVWTGEAAYIFGGVSYDAEPIAEVVRFAPGEGVQVVEGALPYGTKGVPAVWTGEAAYVFGNCKTATEGHFDVIRFDPGTNETEVIEDAIPIPGAGAAAVWADEVAYIFGGRVGDGFSDRIVRYDTTIENGTFVGARLPSGRFGAAAAWDGSRAYVFGGSNALVCGPAECVPTEYLDEIVVYDPVRDVAEPHWARLPSARDLRAAVWADGLALVLGGDTREGPTDAVVAFDPSAPFVEEGDGPPLLTQYVLVFVGVLVLALVVAATVSRWREQPPMSGGTLQS